jgi:hypothetical protein
MWLSSMNVEEGGVGAEWLSLVRFCWGEAIDCHKAKNFHLHAVDHLLRGNYLLLGKTRSLR